MTTTTDTLTRWLPLFEKDESLRPKAVTGRSLVVLPDYGWRWMGEIVEGWDCGDHGPCEDPGMAIRDTAEGWLATKLSVQGGMRILRNDYQWEIMKRGNVYFTDVIGSGDTRDDALFEAVKAAMNDD